jgi:hypothetical protein
LLLELPRSFVAGGDDGIDSSNRLLRIRESEGNVVPPLLSLDETDTEEALSSVFLRFEDGELALVSEGGCWALPDGAIAKFGAPLDPNERIATVATLALADGCTLRHVRHLSGYDVIARDHLICEALGAEPRCRLTTIAAALGHLGRAAQRTAGAEG